MKIIAVDDELLALDDLTSVIQEVLPECTLNGFRNPHLALEFTEKNDVDIAFLDIEMREMKGLVLAKCLKDINPHINIIFVTGFSQYALDAVSMRCSGYVLKPVCRQEIETEIRNLRNPIAEKYINHIHIRTFGGFEVFVDGEVVSFGRAKAKEVLAYLVNKKGMSVSTRELAAVLWEDKQYNRTQQSYLQTIIAELLTVLKRVGADDIIIKRRNSLAVDVEKFDCDYYNFQRGDVQAVNSYSGDYMSCYSWAEFTVGYLEEIKKYIDRT